jgi:hypothetical protein
MTIDEISNDTEIMHAIDWTMTPEEAVTRYLEWGNNWTHGKNLVRSKNDVAYYFVVNTWDDPPKIYLVKRNSEEAVELAAIDVPSPLMDRFLRSVSRSKGVYAINEEIRAWLETILSKN